MAAPTAPARVRVAGIRDLPALLPLVESAYRGDASRAGWTTEADLLDGQRIDVDMLRGHLVESHGVVLVLGEHGAPTGCCHVARRPDGRCRLGLFAVAPDRQGGGAGTRVLAAGEAYVRDRWGAGALEMTVLAQRDELLAWYARKGYAPTGEREPFPYGDERFGRPRRDDLEFVVLRKPLG